MILFKIKLDQATEILNRCLQDYFKQLKPIPISVEPINEFGIFKFDIDGTSFVNPRIIISNKSFRTENSYKNTILHELIHYSVFSDLKPDEITEAISSNDQDLFDKITETGKYAHGEKWNSKKTTINNIYNLNIR